MIERSQMKGVQIRDISGNKERGDLAPRSVHTLVAIEEAAQDQSTSRRRIALASANSAGIYGGGLASLGAVVLTNCTVSGNSAMSWRS